MEKNDTTDENEGSEQRIKNTLIVFSAIICYNNMMNAKTIHRFLRNNIPLPEELIRHLCGLCACMNTDAKEESHRNISEAEQRQADILTDGIRNMKSVRKQMHTQQEDFEKKKELDSFYKHFNDVC